jgi:hypothetical protein
MAKGAGRGGNDAACVVLVAGVVLLTLTTTAVYKLAYIYGQVRAAA